MKTNFLTKITPAALLIIGFLSFGQNTQAAFWNTPYINEGQEARFDLKVKCWDMPNQRNAVFEGAEVYLYRKVDGWWLFGWGGHRERLGGYQALMGNGGVGDISLIWENKDGKWPKSSYSFGVEYKGELVSKDSEFIDAFEVESKDGRAHLAKGRNETYEISLSACPSDVAPNPTPTNTPTPTPRIQLTYNDYAYDRPDDFIKKYSNWCYNPRWEDAAWPQSGKKCKVTYRQPVTNGTRDQNAQTYTCSRDTKKDIEDYWCEQEDEKNRIAQEPTATLTPIPSTKTVVDTQSMAQIYGMRDGDIHLGKGTDKISVGVRVFPRGGSPDNCIIDSVEYKFQKIGQSKIGDLQWGDEVEGNMNVVNLNVSHRRVDGGDSGSVYENCQSYWADLSYSGIYRLTATYVPHNELDDPIVYKGSTDSVVVNVDVYGDRWGKGSGLKATSASVKLGGTKGAKTEAKISRISNFDRRVKLSDLLAEKNKNSNIAGVEAVSDGGGNYTAVNDSNSTTNSLPLVFCISTDGVNCDTDNIPTLHATATKIKNDGSVKTILDDANFQNGGTFDAEIDLNNDKQVQATASRTEDPTSDYSASQGEMTVYVNDKQNSSVQTQTTVNISSDPSASVISSLDNPKIEASTNKAVDNPVFEVTKNGQTSMEPADPNPLLGCQDGTGECVYTLTLTQPMGDYSITFSNGDVKSKELKFNTTGNSQSTTGGTNMSSAAEITRVVVSVDGGAETELPLDKSLVDLDLVSLPARVQRIVTFADNTTKEETFYINSDTNSSGGAASATQACTDTVNHPSYPQCAGTTGLEDKSKYIPGHLYTVQPLCDNNGQGGVAAYDTTADLGESADCPTSDTSSSGSSTETLTPEPQSGVSSNPYWYCLGNAIMQVNPGGDEFEYEKCGGYQCQAKTSPGYDSDAECVSTGEQNTSSGQTSQYTATGNIYWVCSSDNTYIVEVDPGGNGKLLEDEKGTCQDQGKTCQPKTTEGYYSDAECI